MTTMTGTFRSAPMGETSAHDKNYYARPLDALVGQGKNMKYVKACTELHLAGKRFERLRDFDQLVNLEVLWINDNRLRFIDGLEHNFRIKELYAHNNHICTLKGSLSAFDFLEVLDLSNNQLRDLEKILTFLERFKFLKHLNLRGNPCCEEPDYRIQTIYRLPSVKVFDNHEVTDAERTRAKAYIGGDQLSTTIAFGNRAPDFYGPWNERVSERSGLEQDLGREATKLIKRQAAEDAKGDDVFKVNLFPPIENKMLPPPPGWSELDIPPVAAKGWEDGFYERQRILDQSISGKTLKRDVTVPSRAHVASYKARDKYVFKAVERVELTIDTQQKAKGRARFQGGGGIDLDKELFQKFADRKMREMPARLISRNMDI